MSNSTDLLLADIEQQIYKVIFFFMTTGRFPKNWSSDIYCEYLNNRHRTMRIYVVCFDGSDEEQGYRQKISEQIASTFSHVCAKVYNTMVVCLSFEKEDQKEPICAELKRIVNGVVGNISVCYKSDYMTDTGMLAEAYQSMRKELDAIQMQKACSRDEQVVNIFSLENLLFDQIVDGDIEGLSISLSELADTVEDANRIYMPNEDDLLISTKHYFSYLWRRIARVIYERTGKRKTIQQGVTMDLEMSNLNKREDMLNLVQCYVIQLSDELHLTNQGSFHKIIENVKKYIDDNFASDVSLKYVADQVGLSSYYLSKLFKKEEGVNFKDYVIMVRMEKAMNLINEGKLNINEIACAVGYTNANYFSQAFHKYYGIPPKACQTRGIRPNK